MNDQSNADQSSGSNVKKSALYDIVTRHTNFDFGHFVATTPQGEYDIWNDDCLPMAYSDARDEYNAIRHGCGLFDASPMKKYRFRGSDAGLFLDRILTSQVSQMPPMKAAYGLMCNEDGLLLDDGIVLKLAEDDYIFLITERDHDAYFAGYNTFKNCAISDETSSFAGLALQGPKSCAVLSKMGLEDIETLKPFSLRYYKVGGRQVILGRLGFTGDLGYEIWFHPDILPAIAEVLDRAERALDIQLLGYGLTAVQICRIEAGMIVPGWDTAGLFESREDERTPFELTLGWNVKLDREDDFAGKNALLQHKTDGPLFGMRGFVIEDPCQIEDGQKLFARIDGDQVEIGALRSTIFHVVEEKWIGFASIKVAHKDAKDVFVFDGGQEIPCTFCKLPILTLDRRTAVPASLEL